MRWVRRALLVALLVGVMIGGWRFAAENQEPVRLHYVAGEFAELALWKVVLGAFFAGAGLVGLFAGISSAKKGLITRRYRKAIGGLEAEVHQLRNLPLAPESEASGVAVGPPQAEGALGRDG
jgi:uncharacterized integral membrane protein